MLNNYTAVRLRVYCLDPRETVIAVACTFVIVLSSTIKMYERQNEKTSAK